MGSLVRVGEIFRYKADKDPGPAVVDGYRNFFHVTSAPGLRRAQLERGIDGPSDFQAVDGVRRPAILIRSSPWKAGSEQTPWHDVFDMNGGHVRYFGDHKAETRVPVGETLGNRTLLQAFAAHQAPTPDQRRKAVPLLVFRSVRRNKQDKGYVEFCGFGIVERVERVVQWARADSSTFVNYVFDLALLDLSSEDDRVDWSWVNDRRNAELTVEQTLAHAPRSWREWVDEGAAALPRLRRRVARASLQRTVDQRPRPGSPEAADLERIYHRFDGKKIEFENLAAAIAARVIRHRGAEYHEGWLTRPSQDGGTDFVGRLDVGIGPSVTKLVVLGQAKCVAPGTNISADQVARVVARLQRGWIGVYVTTGVFSTRAQMEIAEDRYPIILIHGLMLAQQVRQLCNETHAGDLDACVEDLVEQSTAEVVHRRPEEILLT
ncbi:restriction endonuclease [Amycolatopsis magusensis]|uniref:restriction endonuclease n=1 Tax=Amycolatopsis magusensis TaxID=882444 RepID=UPI0024A9E829|nr:restriction endonuclease [Amycolatopsis magusensis]MDI5978571.1 restriction endonuclease [Amycolatopsis magusensis]